MSLTPNEVLGAVSLILWDVCGDETRETDLTAEEWQQIDQRWQTLKALNAPKEIPDDSHK